MSYFRHLSTELDSAVANGMQSSRLSAGRHCDKSLSKVSDSARLAVVDSDFKVRYLGDFWDMYHATLAVLSSRHLLGYVQYSRNEGKGTCLFRFKHDSWFVDTDSDITVSASISCSFVEGKGVAVTAIFGFSGAPGFTDTIRGYVSDGDLAHLIASFFEALSRDGMTRSYYIDAWDDFSIALSNMSEHPGFTSEVKDSTAQGLQGLEDTPAALADMYDELTDRALRWYRIEFTDVTRRADYFTVAFARTIFIPTSESHSARKSQAPVLCDVGLRVGAVEDKKLQAVVTVGMQSISGGVSYESEYAGSGYINTVRATLESPARVNKFIESFLSLLGNLQADGYDYDYYTDQVEKFAGKVSPKSAVSDAAGAKDSRREFPNSLTEGGMFGAYHSIVARCAKKGLLSDMSFSADSDGAHIHLAHSTRLTDTDEECTISGSIAMLYWPWQGVEVVVSYSMAPVYSQFNLETHAYLQTQDGLSAFVRLAVNYLESLASDGQTRAFFVDVSDDMDRDLRKLSERLGFIQNLGEVSDSLSQEAALSIVREHADEIMRAANIPYTKVTSVTPWGDVWVFRYLNKAGVPMAVNFGRNGEGSSMGRSVAVRSRIIHDLLRKGSASPTVSKRAKKEVVSDATSDAASLHGLSPIESTSEVDLVGEHVDHPVESMSGGKYLYRVLLWPGSGYALSAFYVRADSSEEALDVLSRLLIKKGLSSYYLTEEEYQRYLADAKISEEEDTAYIYVDGTMEGADYPIHLLSENMRISKIS